MPLKMLRLLFALFLVLLISMSCNDNRNEAFLFGTWKLDNVKNTAADSILEIVTFWQPDSLYSVTLINDTPQNQMFGKFKVSGQNKFLTTYYGPSYSFKFEILRLTESILEVRQSGKKLIQKYSRLK